MSEAVWKTNVPDISTTVTRAKDDVERRIFRDVVITSERQDRERDIVRVKGALLDDYLKNPVVLFAHNRPMSGAPPIPVGRSLRLKKKRLDGGTKALAADFQFPKAGVSQLSDEIHNLWTEEFLRATSIGFIPRKMRAIDPETGKPLDEEDNEGFIPMRAAREFLEWEMLEFSIVAVGANPDAVREHVGKDSAVLEHFYPPRVPMDTTWNVGEMSSPNGEWSDKWVKDKDAFDEPTPDPSTRSVTVAVPSAVSAILGDDLATFTTTAGNDTSIFPTSAGFKVNRNDWSEAKADIGNDVKRLLIVQCGCGRVVVRDGPTGAVSGHHDETGALCEGDPGDATGIKLTSLVGKMNDIQADARIREELIARNAIVLGVDELVAQIEARASQLRTRAALMRPFVAVLDAVEEKAGRVLSEKNKKILEDAVAALKRAADALAAVLEAASPKPSGDDEDKKSQSAPTSNLKPEELDEKTLARVVLEILD
jgi:hypothetical protein